MQDKKFGFGGKKRWLKRNTAESSADMSAFNPAKHSRKTAGPGGGGGGRGRGRAGARGGNKGGGGGKRGGKGDRGRAAGGKKGKTIRLGKSRRQKMKPK